VRGIYGKYNHHDCQLFTVTDHNNGFGVSFTDLGASVLRVRVPTKHNTVVDVALTEDTPERLMTPPTPYFGATIGRVANRIGYSKFELDGKLYKLFANSGPHSLHGGEYGFDKKIWKLVEIQESDTEVVIVFSYTSLDKEEGYPGNLETKLSYHVQPLKIWWEVEGTTDHTTIVNITNHTYWNLDGVGGVIDAQEIQLPASFYNATDNNDFPTGEIKEVGEELDMRLPRLFSDVFAKHGNVDNNFFLDEAKLWHKAKKDTHLVAKVKSLTTGIAMTITSTDPGVQLYTGNNLTGRTIILGGVHYALGPHYAFCLETQKVPNAINTEEFKEQVILRPNEVYYHKTVHDFHVVA